MTMRYIDIAKLENHNDAQQNEKLRNTLSLI